MIILALVLIGPSRLFCHAHGPGRFLRHRSVSRDGDSGCRCCSFSESPCGFAAAFDHGRKRRRLRRNLSSGKALREAHRGRAWLAASAGRRPGCTYPEERPSSVRRVYHSFVFWGFLLDFVSTSLAFMYQDFLHHLPPYPLTSAPVIFGSRGRRAADHRHRRPDLVQMEERSRACRRPRVRHGLRVSDPLGLTALTGLLTLLFRATPALGSLLVLHLALIAAFSSQRRMGNSSTPFIVPWRWYVITPSGNHRTLSQTWNHSLCSAAQELGVGANVSLLLLRSNKPQRPRKHSCCHQTSSHRQQACGKRVGPIL